MKFKKAFFVNLILAVLSVFLISFFSQKSFLKRIELLSLDSSFRIRGSVPTASNIIIIEITDDDIAAVGSWPWKRTWYAAAIHALQDLGVKYIYFDIVLSEDLLPEDDVLFEEVLKSSGNVYLPFVFNRYPFSISDALLPLKRFADYSKTAPVNIYPDLDGVLRQMPIFYNADNQIYPSIPLMIFMDDKGLKIKQADNNCLVLTNSEKTVKIPVIQKDKIVINWIEKWENLFTHYDFIDLLAEYKEFKDSRKSGIDFNKFKNSICFITNTSIGLYDIKPVPIQPVYPGIGIVATTLDNLLSGRFFHYAPFWVNFLILCFMCFLPAYLNSGKKPLIETAGVILVAGGYFLIHFLLLKNNILITLAYPLCGLFLSYILINVFNFFSAVKKQRHLLKIAVTDELTGIYNIRYFKVVLDEEFKLAKIDPSKRKFCVLMIDFDYFKKVNDTYGHSMGDFVLSQITQVLKSCIRASDVISRYGGDEIVVLLRMCSLDKGMRIAEKLRYAVENYVFQKEQCIHKGTVSIGISTYKFKSDTMEEIIKRADLGLYKAKESGRNRVCCVGKSK
ncbi:MAG: diguanylate cyclase [Candidatus Omnitrophota bacterium]